MRPGFGLVDGFSIHSQPLTHLTQSLLKDWDNATIMSWANVHQQVATTTVNIWNQKGDIIMEYI